VRLGAFLLIPAALTAQSTLPWNGTQELPWETAIPETLPLPWKADGASPSSVPQRLVSLSGDGTLRISDTRGRVTLRLGLSGRPLRILRDAGIPMTLSDFPSHFPAETPLTKGLGNLPLAGDDFRNALQGLLWIMDDGERRITVVHPATQQVVYLPLPAGQNWEINLYPDRLEVREKALPGEDHREKACWSISWLILLPQFVRLSLPPTVGSPGTAFHPFPAE
jgi:hypothetical protein